MLASVGLRTSDFSVQTFRTTRWLSSLAAASPGSPPRTKWSGRAPAGGAHDPDAVDLPDDRLIDIASRDLAGVLGIAGPPALARAYRFCRAGAQHAVGQLARVQEIGARLSRHPGLLVAGSGFRSVGIPDCIADGRAAAEYTCR